MNTSHYPGIELCRRLTEIGFPETEHSWDNNGEEDNFKNKIAESSYGLYVCPSIIELLQAIRTDRRNLALRRYTEQEYSPIMGKIPKSLPNFLAEFVIWDYEHKELTF